MEFSVDNCEVALWALGVKEEMAAPSATKT